MSAQYQLIMHTGPTQGKIFPVEGDIITIGRESENQIVINDAEVSRKHSQLILQGGKYILSDLGSTNGTFVNGQRLTGQHILQPGEIISLGEQISLSFDLIPHVDPNATMVSASHIPGPRPAAQPAQQSVAQPAYAGHVPVGPAPTPAAGAKPNTTRLLLIIVAVLLLCVICACIGAIWWIDSNAYWCKYLPFLFPTGCG